MHFAKFLYLVPALLGAFGMAAPSFSLKFPPKIRALSTFHDLSTLNFEDRVAAYSKLPKQKQGEYWIGKIEKFKEQHPGLNDTQIQTLDSAMEYAQSFDESVVPELNEKLVRDFGKEVGGNLASLRNEDEVGAAVPNCNCNHSMQDCSGGRNCVKLTSKGCTYSTVGCAWSFTMECNGICF